MLSSQQPIESLSSDPGLRTVLNVILSTTTSVGTSSVMRSVGSSHLPNFDPFVLLDHFQSDPLTSNSEHPHRGFEAVTYCINGVMVHACSTGDKGKLQAGDAQWLFTGKGIIHDSLAGPAGCEGFQLGINVKAKNKMSPPRYKEMKRESIPEVAGEGVNINVIAGEVMGVSHPSLTYTPVMYLDIQFASGSAFNQPIPEGWNAVVYGVLGEVKIDGKHVHRYEIATLSKAESAVRIESEHGGRVLLLAGEPCGEPIVQSDAFVMNTEQEIREASEDYQAARNGFELAATWHGDLMPLLDL